MLQLWWLHLLFKACSGVLRTQKPRCTLLVSDLRHPLFFLEPQNTNYLFFFIILLASVCDFVLTQGFYLLFAVGGNVVNIALDPILIFTLKLGVSGAAIATVISQ